jgi:histidinol dehydrogenase
LEFLLMKLVKTFGRSKAAADALIETLEQRGAVSTTRVEPVVRRIVEDVRRRSDRALLAYAVKFDGLAKGQPLLVSREEMKSAWEATAPKLQAAMMVARGNILAFAEAQLPREWTMSPAPGVKTGQIVRSPGQRRLLCSGWPISIAFNLADDGNASTSSGG